MKNKTERDPTDVLCAQLGKSRKYVEDHLYLVTPLVSPGQTKEEFLSKAYSPLPGSRSKMPHHINMALNIISSFCPVCGDSAKDGRFKREISGPSLFTRRFTDAGVTRECRCGLRFYFTWRTFVNVMKRRLEVEKSETMKDWLNTWIVMIETYFGLNDEDQLAKIEALRQRSRKNK